MNNILGYVIIIFEKTVFLCFFKLTEKKLKNNEFHNCFPFLTTNI